jgi:hypothetical protein
MDHKFHQTISGVLDIDVAPGRLVWDPACGGSQWISLFREPMKSRGARYACADAVLIADSSVRLILEIEEAGTNGFLPTRIAGKLTTSALCQYFIPRGRTEPVPFSEHVTFVQVVNAAGLKDRSRKRQQYQNMEEDIRNRLMPMGSIRAYHLIAGNADEFQSGNSGDRLRKILECATNRDNA